MTLSFGGTLAIAIGMIAAGMALIGAMIKRAEYVDSRMSLDAEDREEQA